MKKLNVLMILFMVISVSSMSFANTDPGEEDGFTFMTVAELKAQYGEENIEILTSMELLDTDVVAISNSPCNGVAPCGGALGKARAQAQKLANECCCVQFFGAVCCQANSGSIIAVDGIVLPTSPQCD